MRRLLVLVFLAAGVLLGAAAPVVADVEDFHFDSFDAQYSLATDPAGHSELKTVETLVAVFPETNQNHGIRRALVDRYDGHPTDLRVVSVTDGAGAGRSFQTKSDGDFLEVTIAADRFVHGRQTYRITYTQRNVTRYFADTNADEFYWDTNGTGWRQPFAKVTASVHLAAGLLPRLTGKVAAVSGASGEARPASVRRTADGFRFSATGLGPGENLTLAIGFRPGTFTPRDSGFFAAPWPPLALLGAIASLVVLAGALVVRVTRLQDAPGAGLIVPEYLPPKGVNPLLASVIVRRTGKATAAQILDLAVAGNVRVLEDRTGKRGYRLEFRSADGADSHELEFLHALFGNTLTRSEQRRLDRTDARAVKRIADLMKRVKADAVEDGYRRQVPVTVVGWLFAGAAAAAVATVIFAVVSLGQAYGSWWPALLLALAVAAAGTTGILLFRVPVTVRGARMRDYLKGLEEYIALAEADRLRYLQSPQGAQRVPVSTDDRSQLVKLNERLLPYAVLFGQEKKWARELGRSYEELGAQPSWYVGSGPFNASLFASSVGALATSAASAYSSTGGGSGGGATSGGGGGGGGGGGV